MSVFSTVDGISLQSFIVIARLHDIAVQSEEIKRQYATEKFGADEILRVAKACSLKARISKVDLSLLSKIALPALMEQKDGSFVVIGKVAEGKAIILRPGSAPSLHALEDLAQSWTGRFVLFTKRTSLSDLAFRFDISWFIRAIYKYRNILFEVLIASFFLQLFALVTPLFFQVITDKVLTHRGVTTLDVLIIGLLAVSVFETILGGLRTYVFSHTTNRIDVELGARLFQHLLALPIAYFEARRAGDSVARVRELENVRNFITSSSLTLVIDLLFTVIFLAVMFYYSSLLTWIVIGSFPIYVMIALIAAPVFRSRLDEKFNRGAENQAFLVESVSGIQTLKAMAIEPQMQRRWEDQLANYVTSSFRVTNLSNWASQLVQLASKFVTGLTLYFGAYSVMSGDMTIGQLIAFNMLAGRVAQPILRLAQVGQDFQQMRISIERLGDILNTIPEPSIAQARSSLPEIKGEVIFDHVSFRYRIDGAEILHDVSLKVPPGQVIGIVGPSGSGKSTLTKLIQRLYVPQSGRVLVDGADLSVVDVAWLRRQVGSVLQENVLFNRSIRDNIALAAPGLPMEQVIAAAQLAGAHEFILELPQGYDTVVGERGSSLSGGQRQRIAIARALITNPRILIFDEATSALDYESERAIQNNMQKIASGRTVIIIAHRLSTVRHADRIITIEKGRIVEDGTHDQLLKSNGRYAALYNMQARS